MAENEQTDPGAAGCLFGVIGGLLGFGLGLIFLGFFQAVGLGIVSSIVFFFTVMESVMWSNARKQKEPTDG